MTKPFYTSKSFWFGALFVVNSLAVAFGFGDFTPGADLSAVTSAGIGLIVWVLRYYTDKEVTIS